jgi:MFS family permease
MGLLRNAGFRLLLAGFFLSTVAPWAGRTAILIWVYALTGSGVMVSLVGLAEALPLLLLAPVAGVFVDRWSRSRTMAVAALAQAALLPPLFLVHDRSGLPIILIVVLLVNIVAQFSVPAASAAIPVVAGEDAVAAANSMIQLLNGLVLILAPALAAALYAAVGPRGLFLVLIAIYLLAAPLLAAVPAARAERSAGAEHSVVGEMLAGLRYVRRSRLLLSIMAVAFVALLGAGGLSVLDVVFVTRALHDRSESVGVLFAANGIGQLLGGLAVMAVSARLAARQHVVLGISVLLNAVAVAGYAVAPSLTWAAVALLCCGASFAPLIISFMTLLQLGSEDAFRGRVMSLVNTGMAAAMLASLSASGALADAIGVRQTIALGAALFALSGLLTLALIHATPGAASSAEPHVPLELSA